MVARRTGYVAALLLGAALVTLACEGQEAEPQTPAKATKPKPPPAPEPKPAPEPEPEPPAAPKPKTPATFAAAVDAAQTLWAEPSRTFLCECPFRAGGRVSHAACGYLPRADDDAARKFTWTHVVPPREFGSDRACWTKPGCKDGDGKAVSGVACCVATDPEFVAMYTDLHNVAPMIEEIAFDRAGLPFGEVEGEERLYGRCDFEVDGKQGIAEPPDARRGDVARAYLYMDATYPDAMNLSPLTRRRLGAWAAEDPPDDVERARAKAISAQQGVPHPWLAEDVVGGGAKAPTEAPAADDESATPQEPAAAQAKAPSEVPPTEAKAAAAAKAPKDAKAPAEAKVPAEAKAPAEAKTPAAKAPEASP